MRFGFCRSRYSCIPLFCPGLRSHDVRVPLSLPQSNRSLQTVTFSSSAGCSVYPELPVHSYLPKLSPSPPEVESEPSWATGGPTFVTAPCQPEHFASLPVQHLVASDNPTYPARQAESFLFWSVRLPSSLKRVFPHWTVIPSAFPQWNVNHFVSTVFLPDPMLLPEIGAVKRVRQVYTRNQAL